MENFFLHHWKKFSHISITWIIFFTTSNSQSNFSLQIWIMIRPHERYHFIGPSLFLSIKSASQSILELQTNAHIIHPNSIHLVTPIIPWRIKPILRIPFIHTKPTLVWQWRFVVRKNNDRRTWAINSMWLKSLLEYSFL